ncbi:MAG: hypothetical protein KKA62_00160 [Nanoarchaeota archaeon]|nr:hypothetical protein [Nanoarchaeota archaeon]
MPKAEIDLQVHPFLEKNSIVDIINTMYLKQLDIVALASLDKTIYPRVLDQIERNRLSLNLDPAGVKLTNNKYLLNAREYNSKEGFQVVTVGYTYDSAAPNTEIRKIIDYSLNNKALVILDHPFAENKITHTAGHISEEKEKELEELCKEYSGLIALEWNAYSVPWIRKGLKMALNSLHLIAPNIVGYKTKYHDINKKTEEFSEKLQREGYHLPILADSDLHARTGWHLKTMGVSRVIAELNGECASEIVENMKKNFFSGKYENVKRYAGPGHVLSALCIPLLFPKIFKNPRG